jgi:uncharacterized ferredoxin-like protein
MGFFRRLMLVRRPTPSPGLIGVASESLNGLPVDAASPFGSNTKLLTRSRDLRNYQGPAVAAADVMLVPRLSCAASVMSSTMAPP